MQGNDFTAILAMAKDGDQTACEMLWSRHAPGVVGYLRAKGSREPEDQASEVFLAVFKTLAQFEGDEAAFRSFIFTIAYRRLVDELRRRGRRIDEVPWDLDNDSRTTVSAEEAALERIGNDEVRAALEQLPGCQRDVLLLRVLADLTVDQVAATLGKHQGAVKALQRRGLARLQRQLPFAPAGRVPSAA